MNLGANPNEPDIFGFTPLHYAAAKGDSMILDQLLGRGAQVDAHSRDGTTALHIAAKYGHLVAVKMLLDHKAQVNVKDSTKRTPLHWATYRRKYRVVENLLRSSLSTARVHDFQQKTALHLAAARGDILCAEILIDHSHREARDQAGMTALHISAMKGSPEIVKLLLNHNSHGDATDSAGSTPLHLAVLYGHKSVVESLLEHKIGVNTEVRDAKENTALHIATLECRQQIVKLLLRHNADTQALDGENHIALEVAMANGFQEIVAILLRHGEIGDCIGDGEYRAFYTAAQILERNKKQDESYQNYLVICNLFLQREVDRGLAGVMVGTAAPVSNTDTETSTQKEGDGGPPPTYIPKDHSAANIRPKQTALHIAAEFGHDCTAKLLLDRGVDKETKTATGRTALHLAATHGRTSIVQILLIQGANKSSKDDNGDMALHLAVKGNHIDVVRILLKLGASGDPAIDRSQTSPPSERDEVNSEGADGYTPLSLAAARGYWKLCQLLLQHNADITINDRAGNTALHLATIGRYEVTVECLIQHGAPLDVENDSGQTPLRISISAGTDSTERRQRVERWLLKTRDNANRPSLPIAKLLLSKGATINITDCRGNTELHLAAKMGQEKVVELLLKHGAAINNANGRGRRALHLAAKRGHKTIAKSLLDSKASVNAQDSKGKDTALHLALVGEHKEVVQLLLEYGAATDIKNQHGRCADLRFVFTSCKGGETVAHALIKHGAAVNFTNDAGRTPLHTACNLGYESVAMLLLKRGVDINARDNEGNTALHIAVRGSREGVAELLLQNGAAINTEDRYGRSPSVWAAILGRRGMTKLMCAIAAKPSYQGRIYETALQISILKHDMESVRQLLRSGANPDDSDEHGWTATLCATQSNAGRPILRLLESFQQTQVETQTLPPKSWSTRNKELNLQLRGEQEALFTCTYSSWP